MKFVFILIFSASLGSPSLSLFSSGLGSSAYSHSFAMANMTIHSSRNEDNTSDVLAVYSSKKEIPSVSIEIEDSGQFKMIVTREDSEGVTLFIDADGDGLPEKGFSQLPSGEARTFRIEYNLIFSNREE